jgi:hypothetical protein
MCLPCIVCEKDLEDVYPSHPGNQPLHGTAFTTHGHYGSTVFDPMDGSYLDLSICDECLVNRAMKGMVYIARPKATFEVPVRYSQWKPKGDTSDFYS